MKQTNEQIKNAAEIIRSLGHPARVKMLLLLRKMPKMKMTVTQIQEELCLTQPETSRHLSVLKNCDVLLCEKEGSSTFYSINEENMFVRGIADYISKFEKNSDPENEKKK